MSKNNSLITMYILKVILVTIALFGAISAQSKDWWETAVFYQVYPRSFKDSDNNGTGDLQGVVSKLDHLKDTGVTAVWFSPIYASPGIDAGYDISDFKSVDPIFGTMADFEELLLKAHELGLKVILDFVPNHSSHFHEWFQKSEAKEPGYEDYYVWVSGTRDTPPNNWQSYFHGPAWTWSDARGQWYLHQFAYAQPDLNYRNPSVVQEMKDVLTFWLDKGVDGFRVDIISALFEVEGYPDEPCDGGSCTSDQPETYDMVYQWRALLDQYQATHGGETRVMMTESYSSMDKVMPYYGNRTHNGAHFPFNFLFITRLFAQGGDGIDVYDIRSAMEEWLSAMPAGKTADWVLGNHDQHRMASRFGVAASDQMIMLQMFLPGVAVTYNGEEICMENGVVTWEQAQDPQACNGDPGEFQKNCRDFERTPFHWDDSVNAGFNEGGETWLPVSDKYRSNNLAQQNVAGIKSHYNMYKELIQLRKRTTMINGALYNYVFDNDGKHNVFLLTRELAGNETLVLIMNTRGYAQAVDYDMCLAEENSVCIPSSLTLLLANTDSFRVVGDPVPTTGLILSAYESLIMTGHV